MRAGLRPNPGDWDDLIVSQRQMLQLLESAADAAGDAHLPARVGGRIMAALPVVTNAMSHASNLAEAIRAANRALKLWREGVDFRIAAAGRYAAISQHFDDVSNEQSDILGEMAVSALCSIIRSRIETTWTPVAVVLPHGRARFHHGLDEFFQAPVFYRPGPARLVFDVDLLTLLFRPLPLPAVAAPVPPVLLLRDCDRLMEQLHLLVGGMLALGDLSLERASFTLGVPMRTLQAQLAHAGSSFSEVVEERRRKLAVQHLSGSDLRVGEIAMLLGYNDSSNFTRAFRRWHGGVSPSDFRHRALRG